MLWPTYVGMYSARLNNSTPATLIHQMRKFSYRGLTRTNVRSSLVTCLNHTAISTMSARDTVLHSAHELFTHKGYFNTSMRDITRESQVSTGSIYHYFSDKEGVAAALYQNLMERMQTELQQISQQHDTAQTQCRAVIRLLFDIADAEPQVMAFMLYTKHREFLPEERPICSSAPFEQMREMVRRGMQRGEIRQGDVFVASSCLFGGSIRMITSALDGLLQQPLSSYLEEVWGYSWQAVAAQV